MRAAVSPEELAAIKERLAAATPGPWDAVWEVCYGWEVRAAAAERPGYESGSLAAVWKRDRGDSDLLAQPDAEFIAHAREDVPALVAEIERLQHMLDWELEADELW
jgi:hypothetical protein